MTGSHLPIQSSISFREENRKQDLARTNKKACARKNCEYKQRSLPFIIRPTCHNPSSANKLILTMKMDTATRMLVAMLSTSPAASAGSSQQQLYILNNSQSVWCPAGLQGEEERRRELPLVALLARADACAVGDNAGLAWFSLREHLPYGVGISAFRSAMLFPVGWTNTPYTTF